MAVSMRVSGSDLRLLQVFEAVVSLDDNYMFQVRQRVINSGDQAVTLLPWARIRRERTPETAGFFILHEGFTGVLDGRLREVTYSDAKSEAAQRRGGVAMEQETGAGRHWGIMRVVLPGWVWGLY